VLLVGGQVVFAVFHGTLVGAQARVGGRQMGPQAIGDGVEGQDERGEVEGDAGRARVGLPEEDCFGFFAGTSSSSSTTSTVKGGVGLEGRPGEDFVVPAPADGPACDACSVDDLAADLVRRRGLPAARFEVEVGCFAGFPVLDFHGPVVVDGGVAGDDADDRRRDFFPGVQFFFAVDGAQLAEPGAEQVDVEGFAVELGLERRFALLKLDTVCMTGGLYERVKAYVVLPPRRLGPRSANRRVVADLLDIEAILLVRAGVLERLAEKRIERLRNTADRRRILADRIGGDVQQPL
jgi:hypothetical protein